MSAVLPVRRQTARAATTALFLGNGLLVGTWAANLPRMKETLALSDAGLGTLLLAFGLGAVGAMTVAGVVAGRLGAGRLASFAGVVLALLFPAIAVLRDWPLLLGLSVLLGAVTGTMDVAMNAYGTQLERRWGGAIMSSLHAGWSMGGLAGALISGALAGLGAGLFATFSAAAVLVAAGGAAGFVLPQLDGRPPPRVGRWFRLPSRQLAVVCLLAALGFESEGAIIDWSGVYLNTVVGTDTAWATTGYAAFALTMVVGRVTGDAVIGRFGPARVVRLGTALALVGLGIGLAVPNRYVVDAGLVLAGAGLANVVPAIFSAGGRIAGTNGIAMVSATGYSGLLVAPPLLGNVADAIGLRLALVLVLAAMAAIVVLGGAVATRGAGPD